MISEKERLVGLPIHSLSRSKSETCLLAYRGLHRSQWTSIVWVDESKMLCVEVQASQTQSNSHHTGLRPPPPRIHDRAPTNTVVIPLSFRIPSRFLRRRRRDDHSIPLGVGDIVLPPPSHAAGLSPLFRIRILRPPRTDRASSNIVVAIVIIFIVIVIATGTSISVPSLLCSNGPRGRVIPEEGRSVAIIV
jgi:hypothetical protein